MGQSAPQKWIFSTIFFMDTLSFYLLFFFFLVAKVPSFPPEAGICQENYNRGDNHGVVISILKCTY